MDPHWLQVPAFPFIIRCFWNQNFTRRLAGSYILIFFLCWCSDVNKYFSLVRWSNTPGWSGMELAEYWLVLHGIHPTAQSGGDLEGTQSDQQENGHGHVYGADQHQATQNVSKGWRVGHWQGRQCPCWISSPGSSCPVVGHWNLVSTSSVLKGHCRNRVFLLACAHSNKQGARSWLGHCAGRRGATTSEMELTQVQCVPQPMAQPMPLHNPCSHCKLLPCSGMCPQPSHLRLRASLPLVEPAPQHLPPSAALSFFCCAQGTGAERDML